MKNGIPRFKISYNQMVISGNLLLFIFYSLMIFIQPNRDLGNTLLWGIIIIMHFIICLGFWANTSKKIWLYAGLIILLIGLGTCFGAPLIEPLVSHFQNGK